MDELQAEMHKRDIKKLGQLVYNSDKYYDEKCSDLEHAVDKHLRHWINFDRLPLERPENGDARVLMSWLEHLQPTE